MTLPTLGGLGFGFWWGQPGSTVDLQERRRVVGGWPQLALARFMFAPSMRIELTSTCALERRRLVSSPATSTAMDTTAQLLDSITSQCLPPPSQSLLTSLTTRSPQPPLPSLVATAKARLLAADLTSSPYLDGAQLCPLPPDTDSANVKEAKLRHHTHVQVVDIENLSLSRWEQVEEMEAIERGERTRGREIIRVADEESADAAESLEARGTGTGTGTGPRPPVSAAKKATHRLVLQDCKGARVFAVELTRIDGIGVGKTNMGCKMLLRAGTPVARGIVLLTPENCVLLGGKIDAWHDAWMNGRMARLKEAAGAGNAHTTTTTTTTTT